MMENSASPRGEASAPITAVEFEIRPATGAWICTLPPSGSVSRARFWPAVTVSPASAMISATFSPGRSGRTMVSSRGMMMPEASTMAGKQNFAAFSTVTVAPFGPSFGASRSSAAREGEARARQSRAVARGARRFREGPSSEKWFIGVSVRFQGLSIAEGQRASQADFEKRV